MQERLEIETIEKDFFYKLIKSMKTFVKFKFESKHLENKKGFFPALKKLFWKA